MTRATSVALRVGAPIIAAVALLAGTIVLAHLMAPSPPIAFAAPPLDQTVVCVEQSAPPPIVDLADERVPLETPTATPTPGDDVYARLAACLRDAKVWPTVHVTVGQVRYWVEVEKDPAWRENGAWWLPLSGEGEEHMPSGVYISVPDTGTTCGGAIVN